ncbi:pentatricopeptide repeat-containing protein, mitochondrial isoform X2 [Capsicum galapagoense]
MLQMGIGSAKAFNTLIDRFLKNGNVVEIKQLLKKMTEGCIGFDQDTYTLLIEQLCKDGLMEEAEMLISEMQKRDLVLKDATYSRIFHGYHMMGERSRLCAIFQEMVRKGINPENGILPIVLDAFSNEGNLLDAFKLFMGMLEKRTPLSVSACESLIEALCLDGKYGKALEFLLVR